MPSKEHYVTEQHQQSVVTLVQDIIEKEKTNSEIDLHLDENYESGSTLTQSIETLNDKLVQLSTEALQITNQLRTFTEELNDVEKVSSLQKTHIKGTLINQTVLSQDVLAIKQQTEYENQVTKQQIPDGTMIWKITNVQEKMYDAESERQKSIYSPAFYTSATGYKLYIRLYLNGDETARGTHKSIFPVILRGQYDVLLQWSFSYRVSFCLCDQRTMIESGETKQAKNIIESFRPDLKCVSFQQPRSGMNIASGIPKFFSLSEFNQSAEINRYIINDTRFIKVLVDFIGIPESILPFVFTLNIALPKGIQEKFIDEEMKRHQGQNISCELFYCATSMSVLFFVFAS